MFDWRERVSFLKSNPGYNNAEQYGVVIDKKENTNWAAAVYHLTPDENQGGHFIYIEVLCKQNERETYRAINWGWEGMTTDEQNQTGAIYADKPPNEIKTHPIFAGQRIWLEVAGGDKISNLHTVIDPDEMASDGGKGNSRFHHSYLVLFQEVDKQVAPPINPPPIDPNPETTQAKIRVEVNKGWLDTLPVNEEGNIIFEVTA